MTAPLGGPVVTHEPYRDTRRSMSAVVAKHRETFANPSAFALLRGTVEEAVRGIDPKDHISEYLAWFRWVEARYLYRRDPRSVELVKGPDVLLREIAARGCFQEDCESVGLLLGTGADALGGEVRYVTISMIAAPPPPGWRYAEPWPPHTHAFTQALDPATGRWLTLDPVAGPRTAWMLRSFTQARVYAV